MTSNNVHCSETIDHLLIKKYFFDNIPLENKIRTINQEIKIGNRIADVYFELEKGQKVVIEIQHSKISVKELMERTREYNKNDIHVLWILDGIGPYDKQAKNEDKVLLSLSEKILHVLYLGRVYYINASSDGIKSSLYSLHYTRYIEAKKTRYGFIYYRQSKSNYNAVFNEINSLKLKLFRHKGLKLARFFDLNIKKQCISEVSEFINAYINYQNCKPGKAESLCPDGLPLAVIIRKFREKYGLYLLFNVLRYLRVFNMRDAKYMFEKRFWFKKIVVSR
ncbi:MAG: hypothetical protein EU539_08400 [Promethearchaeota archaeon]|nr:MAG: hypothetical protein EU539_08400 [Candidatus Lokiarchaeota archaeon]